MHHNILVPKTFEVLPNRSTVYDTMSALCACKNKAPVRKNYFSSNKRYPVHTSVPSIEAELREKRMVPWLVPSAILPSNEIPPPVPIEMQAHISSVEVIDGECLNLPMARFDTG